MSALFTRRCFRHPAREAAVRCPGCGRTFCRECVTEHAERVLCSACLARARSAPEERGRPRHLRRALEGAAGLLLAFLFFLLLGHVLILVGDSFVDRTARSAEEP